MRDNLNLLYRKRDFLIVALAESDLKRQVAG